MKNFKDTLKVHQEKLISEADIFGLANGGRKLKHNGIEKEYSHILDKGSEKLNLFEGIRDNVEEYFKNNKISFWGGTTVTPNTLSSQVSCLNHLFFIRDKEKIVRDVMQNIVGDKITIKEMVRVSSSKEMYNQQFISFEMVSNEDRMNEGTLTRGNTCTSIDAFAIALDTNNKKHILVIEWKLVEDDSRNKAPTEKTSKNKDEIKRGTTRVERYGKLIKECPYLDSSSITENEDFYNTSFFIAPFYELMRQTLWANRNLRDFNADDYLHINVIPEDNPMRNKLYRCNNSKGIENGWRKLLTAEGDKRYIMANPKNIVDTIKQQDQCSALAKYLNTRYYSYK